MTNGYYQSTYQQPTYQQYYYPPEYQPTYYPTYQPTPQQQEQERLQKQQSRDKKLGILLGLVAVGLGINRYSKQKSSPQTPTCTPSWQCETPLNGYEHDINNCNTDPTANRRLKVSCNPIPIPNIYVSSSTGNDNNNGTQQYPVKTITHAISIANSGNTIYVLNGTYPENVTINKSISLYGENKNNTIIDGSTLPIPLCGNPPVYCGNWNRGLVEIRSDNTTFSSFKVQNSKTSGIMSLAASNVKIENNHIYKTWGSGIQLHGGSNCKIRYNEIDKACSPDIYRELPQEQLSVAGTENDVYDIDVSYNFVHEKGITDGGTLISGGINGIYIKDGVHGGTVHHNYLINNGTIYVDGWISICENIEVYSNIIDLSDTGFQASCESPSGQPAGTLLNVTFRDNISTRTLFGLRTPVGTSLNLANAHITTLTIRNNIFYKNTNEGIKFGTPQYSLPTYSNVTINDNIVCNNDSNSQTYQIFIDNRIPTASYSLSNNHTLTDYILQPAFDTAYNALKAEIKLLNDSVP